MNRYFGTFVLFFPALLVGCGGGKPLEYANVKGSVNFNGKPIEKGKIIFAVAGHAPTSCNIVDGRFSGQAAVGSNKVSVSAMKKSASAPALPPQAQIQLKGYMEKAKKHPNEGMGTISDNDLSLVDYIPAEWGSKSTQVYVIQSGGNNEVEFNIKGPAPK